MSSRLLWVFGMAALLAFQAERHDAKGQPVCVDPAICGSGYGGQSGTSEIHGLAPPNVPGPSYAPARRGGIGSNPYGAALPNPYARTPVPHLPRGVGIPKLPHLKRGGDW